MTVLKMLRERRLFAKIVLWVLVGMLAVGVLITTVPSIPWLDTGSGSGRDERQTPQQQEAQSEVDRLEKLVARYEEMNAERPGDLNVLTGYARVEAELGRLYLMEGEQAKGKEVLEGAAGHYRQVLDRTEDTSLRLELAEVYQLLGSYELAEGQLQAVLRKEPRNLQARAQLGMLYESREEWKRAEEVWKELSQEPDPQTQEFARERLRLLEEKTQGKKK